MNLPLGPKVGWLDQLTLGLIILLPTVGCQSVGEDYVEPNVMPESTEAWNGRFEGVITADDLDTKLLAQWWTSLKDPQLTMLIEKAMDANLDLRAASAKLRQVRGQRQIAAAAGAPQIGTSGSGSRSGGSSNAGPGGTGELFSAGIDASWELDVFGGIARGVEAADADVQSAEEARRDVLISIAAEVALSYADLRAIQSQRDFTLANLKLQEETLAIVEAKLEAGRVSQLDVSRAESQVETTRSSLPTFEQQIVQTSNRIAVLLGLAPGSLNEQLSQPASMVIPSVEVAIGVPAEVLRRRPDVRGAERRLAAESARLGAAVADLYPKFALSGSIGLESLSLSSLFQSASRAFGLGSSVQWTPFNGGRLRAQVDIQEAVREETLIGYESAVLLALEEVENAVSAYTQEQLTYQSLQQAAVAAREAAGIAKDRYDAGQDDYLTLLDAQRSLLNAENSVADSGGVILGNLIRLYKALGGGWDPEAPTTTDAQPGN